MKSERDVLLVVRARSATVTIDGNPHALEQGDASAWRKPRCRAIVAGRDGVRYLWVHRRRGPLQIPSDVARLRTALGVISARSVWSAASGSASCARSASGAE